jgi:hypothetical protein
VDAVMRQLDDVAIEPYADEVRFPIVFENSAWHIIIIKEDYCRDVAPSDAAA